MNGRQRETVAAATAFYLALKWALAPNETARAIEPAARGFAAAIRAATGEPLAPPRKTQAQKIAELRRLYLEGEITLTSFELELAHLPGGLEDEGAGVLG